MPTESVTPEINLTPSGAALLEEAERRMVAEGISFAQALRSAARDRDLLVAIKVEPANPTPSTIHPKVPSKWHGLEEAYLDGLRLDRDALPTYPGPSRMAYQAGWVAGKRLQYAARKSTSPGITLGVPMEWWCDEHRVWTIDLICPKAGTPPFRSEAS